MSWLIYGTGKPLELHQVPALLSLDEDFGKFSHVVCLFVCLIFAAVICLPGVTSENGECSQCARHLTYMVPFDPDSILFTKEQLQLRNVQKPVANT